MHELLSGYCVRISSPMVDVFGAARFQLIAVGADRFQML